MGILTKQSKNSQTARVLRVALVLLLLVGFNVSAQAVEKIALVIANQHYQQKGASLQRPMQDARSMMHTLKQKGFQIYGGRVQINLNQQKFEHVVKDFSYQARGAKVAAVYYAGHGAQDGKSNYLIPVDAKIEKSIDYRYKAVNLSFLLDYLGGSSVPVNLVFLDACRNNPFSTERGNSRGLVRVSTPPEILVSYSTSNGDTAQDQSPYTPALIRNIKSSSHLNILEVMTSVAAEVVRATGGRQRPDFSTSLTKKYCLTGCGKANANSPATQAASPVVRLASVTPVPQRQITAVSHTHNGRSHSHVLPREGVNHQHGGVKPMTPTVAPVRVNHPPKPKPTPQTTNFRGPRMVFVRGGTFMMGSPETEKGHEEDEIIHEVSVGNFTMSATEVTNGEYDRCVATGWCDVPIWKEVGSIYNLKTGSNRAYRFSTQPNQPVVGISWFDATNYASWLGSKLGKRYRLPTEAEWEYAARGGSSTAFPWGSNVGKNRASCNGCSTSRYNAPLVVARFPPNAIGLRDMNGNVWEWTCSAYVKTYNGAESRCESTANASSKRSIRGGSWANLPSTVRSASRHGELGSLRQSAIGFRVVSQ